MRYDTGPLIPGGALAHNIYNAGDCSKLTHCVSLCYLFCLSVCQWKKGGNGVIENQHKVILSDHGYLLMRNFAILGVVSLMIVAPTIK